MFEHDATFGVLVGYERIELVGLGHVSIMHPGRHRYMPAIGNRRFHTKQYGTVRK